LLMALSLKVAINHCTLKVNALKLIL